MTNTLSPSLWHWFESLNWLLASPSDNHTGIQRLFGHRHLGSKNFFLYFVIPLSNPHLCKHALSQSQKLIEPQNISKGIGKVLLHLASSLVYRLISIDVKYIHKLCYKPTKRQMEIRQAAKKSSWITVWLPILHLKASSRAQLEKTCPWE